MIPLSTLPQRALLSLTTIPDAQGLRATAVITLTTTAASGLLAAATRFINPVEDYHPPWSELQATRHRTRIDPAGSSTSSNNFNIYRAILKPVSAFVFPSLVEEFVWRGLLIPHPSSIVTATTVKNTMSITTTITNLSSLFTTPGLGRTAVLVLALHVLSHPLAGLTVWPRGRDVFCDKRFLLLAFVVLGGATASYIVTRGSIWAATITHGLPVMLWRDFFGGESKLLSQSGQGRIENNMHRIR